jgi:hypothetical protein
MPARIVVVHDDPKFREGDLERTSSARRNAPEKPKPRVHPAAAAGQLRTSCLPASVQFLALPGEPC